MTTRNKKNNLVNHFFVWKKRRIFAISKPETCMVKLRKRVHFLDYDRVTKMYEGMTKVYDSIWE